MSNVYTSASVQTFKNGDSKEKMQTNHTYAIPQEQVQHRGHAGSHATHDPIKHYSGYHPDYRRDNPTTGGNNAVYVKYHPEKGHGIVQTSGEYYQGTPQQNVRHGQVPQQQQYRQVQQNGQYYHTDAGDAKYVYRL